MTTHIEQLIAAAEAEAAAFHADPQKGQVAGYQPAQEWGWTKPAVGQGRERIPQRQFPTL